MLTSTKVTRDIYAMLKSSELAQGLSGGVYHYGMRPRTSTKEDAVIAFIAGLSNEIESGIVSVVIYVNDIDPFKDGIMVMDGERVSEIEELAEKWVETLTADRSNYLFSLQNTIYVEAEPNINQHSVVVKIAYRYFNKKH